MVFFLSPNSFDFDGMTDGNDLFWSKYGSQQMRFSTKGQFKLSPTLLCLIKPAFPLDSVHILAFISHDVHFCFKVCLQLWEFSESHTLQIINKNYNINLIFCFRLFIWIRKKVLEKFKIKRRHFMCKNAPAILLGFILHYTTLCRFLNFSLNNLKNVFSLKHTSV